MTSCSQQYSVNNITCDPPVGSPIPIMVWCDEETNIVYQIIDGKKSDAIGTGKYEDGILKVTLNKS